MLLATLDIVNASSDESNRSAEKGAPICSLRHGSIRAPHRLKCRVLSRKEERSAIRPQLDDTNFHAVRLARIRDDQWASEATWHEARYPNGREE